MERKKLLVLGDLHITEDVPKNRIDDYKSVLMAKLIHIFSYARKHNCCILQPGDFFDKPNPSYRFFSEIVSLLKTYDDVMVLSIYGQHDMRYRQKENTALGALEHSCGNLRILSGEKSYSLDDYTIYGCGYGEIIPEIRIKNTKSVLLIHKMIVQKKLWDQQTDFVYAKALLNGNHFDIIVSGDNHTSFSEMAGKKILLNCGSLMRSTITQIEHKPVMYMIDGKVCEKIYIPIKENVFDESKIEKEKEISLELDAFVKGLAEQKEMGLNFEDNLLSYFKENKVDKDVQEFIKRCLRD